MNSTLANSTLTGQTANVYALVTFVKSALSIHFLLGIPLNCYIIFLLLPRGGGVDVSVVFWLNNAVAEIFLCIVSVLFTVIIDNLRPLIVKVVDFLFGTSMSARLLFLCCVCLERYLAVVHPVIFLRLKPLRYRVGCSVLAWTCSLVLGINSSIVVSAYAVVAAVNIVVLTVVFFCCVSILRRLRDPGPRDMGSEQVEMNAAKKKAFQIVFINLLICLVQNIPVLFIYSMETILSYYDFSMASAVFTVVNMFIGFVQPVFILHRTGKLRCS